MNEQESRSRASRLSVSALRQRQVYTTGMVAKMCGVAPRTVVKWADSGQLKCYRVPDSNDRRILRWELVRFLKEKGMPLAWELSDPTVYWLGRPALEIDRAASVRAGTVWELAVQTALRPAAVAVIDAGDIGQWAAREAVRGLAAADYPPSIVLVMTEDDTDCVPWQKLGVTVCVPAPGRDLTAIVSKLISGES